jgi:hypothetical protein
VSIVSDSYVLDLAQPEFIHIDYSSLRSTAAGEHELKASLWFERRNLHWLVEALRACIATYGLPESRAASGHDSLRVYESGPEPTPYINLENERSKGAEHGGFQWFAMSKPLAKRLSDELAQLL